MGSKKRDLGKERKSMSDGASPEVVARKKTTEMVGNKRRTRYKTFAQQKRTTSIAVG